MSTYKFKLPAFKIGDEVVVIKTGEKATVNKILPSFNDSVYLLISSQTGIGLGWFYKSELNKVEI